MIEGDRIFTIRFHVKGNETRLTYDCISQTYYKALDMMKKALNEIAKREVEIEVDEWSSEDIV